MSQVPMLVDWWCRVAQTIASDHRLGFRALAHLVRLSIQSFPAVFQSEGQQPTEAPNPKLAP